MSSNSVVVKVICDECQEETCMCKKPEAHCAECDEPMFDLKNNKYWWSRGDQIYCVDCGTDVE